MTTETPADKPSERQQWIGSGLLAGIIVVQAYLLAFVPIGTPRTSDGWEFETGELSDSVPVAQTFRVLAAGLNGVTLYPVPTSNPPAGSVRVSLNRLGHNGHLEDKRLARERVISAAELLENGSWTFEFPSVPDSYDEYFLIEVKPEPDSRGVRLIAVGSEGAYPPGMLMVAGREMPADLRFTTAARSDTGAERLAARFSDSRFAMPILVVAFVLMSGLLVVFLKAVLGRLTS